MEAGVISWKRHSGVVGAFGIRGKNNFAGISDRLLVCVLLGGSSAARVRDFQSSFPNRTHHCGVSTQS